MEYAAAVAPRIALYLMPSVAVLATAALVLGPGRERPAIGARVWGISFSGERTAALRIETIERQFGSDRAVSVAPLSVAAQVGSGAQVAWSGTSGEEGVGEAVLVSEVPFGEATELTIRSGRMLLAKGTLRASATSAVTFAPRMVEGVVKGSAHVSVEVVAGVLAAPFLGEVRVRVAREGKVISGAVVRAVVEGGQLSPTSSEVRTDERGEALLKVVPAWHSVELKLVVTEPAAPSEELGRGEPTTWEGPLPVQPGALWVDMGATYARVISPVPRKVAYVSVVSSKRRSAGFVVPLVRNEIGLFEGQIPFESVAHAEAVTVSGDVQELGPGTVTLAVRPGHAVATAPHVVMLMDGVPFAEQLEKKRAGNARLASVGVAFAAAFFEAVALVLYSRASQQQLAAHFAAASEEGDAAEQAASRAATFRMMDSKLHRAATLVVAVGLVLLAFLAVAAFAIVR